jgi:hypothetical protein
MARYRAVVARGERKLNDCGRSEATTTLNSTQPANARKTKKTAAKDQHDLREAEDLERDSVYVTLLVLWLPLSCR